MLLRLTFCIVQLLSCDVPISGGLVKNLKNGVRRVKTLTTLPPGRSGALACGMHFISGRNRVLCIELYLAPRY